MNLLKLENLSEIFEENESLLGTFELKKKNVVSNFYLVMWSHSLVKKILS